MAVAPSRVAAYEALRRLGAGNADLPQALASTRARLPDERDRALTAEIVTGTERWRAALDFLIQRYAARPLSRLDPEVVDILRLSGYQLLHLDRVPAAAIVDDAVELTRRAGKTSAAGFVNAVLRALARDRAAPPLPRRPAPEAPADTTGAHRAHLDFLAISLSHPRWLVSRWMTRYGFEAAAAWAAFNNEPAPLTLRVNTLRTSKAELVTALASEGVRVQPARFAPDGLVVTEGSPLATRHAGSGLFFVQDEASQLVAAVAAPRPGTRVLDCCAAPGGKATAMAAAMGDRGLLVAADVRRRRIGLLRQTVVESGATCARILQADFRGAPPCRAVFDLVVVDAPCTGLGTLRRDPDVRWRRAEDQLSAFADLERQLLTSAAEAVRPGGRLVYATCSSEPEENEAVVEAFLASHREFRRVDLRDAAPPLSDHVPSLFTAEGCLRTHPHIHGLEAFFAAGLTRMPS